MLKDLSLEFVKAKTVVQLKFQKGKTRDEAVDKLIEGTTELLVLDGPLSEDSLEGDSPIFVGRQSGQSPPQSVELGLLAVGVIVHPENPLESLPLDEVQGIFRGVIKKWPAVRGAAPAINVVGLNRRDPITQLLKEKLIEGERGKSLRYKAKANNQKVILAVARDPAAIGFVDLSQLSPHEKSVKLVPVHASGAGFQPGSAGRPRRAAFLAPDAPPSLAAFSLPENYPLVSLHTLHVSPKAGEAAREFAKYVAPGQCAELLAKHHLLPKRKPKSDR